MKNYSLVKKLSSSFGLVTLGSSIISGLSTENTFAITGKFLESLFFSRVCDCISEEDLKKYYENVDAFWNEQKKEASKNIGRLSNMNLGRLFKIWKIAIMNMDEDSQKNEEIRKLASKLILDVSKTLSNISDLDFDNRLTEYFRSEEFLAKVGMIFKEDIDAKKADEKTLKEIFSAENADALYSGQNGSRDSEKEKKYREIINYIIGKYFVGVPIAEYANLFYKMMEEKPQDRGNGFHIYVAAMDYNPTPDYF